MFKQYALLLTGNINNSWLYSHKSSKNKKISVRFATLVKSVNRANKYHN